MKSHETLFTEHPSAAVRKEWSSVMNHCQTASISADEVAGALLRSADPVMALANFAAYLDACGTPASSSATLLRKHLDDLAALLAGSYYCADALRKYYPDPASYDRDIAAVLPVGGNTLADEIITRAGQTDKEFMMSELRRIKAREYLRIAYGDYLRDLETEKIAMYISDCAQGLIEAATRWSLRNIAARHGATSLGFSVIALGKLGGREVNYSSDVDILFLISDDATSPVSHTAELSPKEYFNKVSQLLIQLLDENTAEGHVFRVDTRLRPFGDLGPLAVTVQSAVKYYQQHGRTWERQMLLKARPIAGDIALGERFVREITPFVYQASLDLNSIREIRELKTLIERNTEMRDEALRDIKTGYGGIRDIEFTVQFLQLLHGHKYPALHVGSTVDALRELELTKCISREERLGLEDAYLFLRKVEHRLQMLHQLQTHLLPESDEELAKLAKRMGYHTNPIEQFQKKLSAHTRRARTLLNRLLHDAFKGLEPHAHEVNLILAGETGAGRNELQQTVDAALARVSFKDPQRAYRNLMALSQEAARYTSTGPRVQRMFAAIVPHVMRFLARTPDPDMTLNNFEQCCAALGGKSMLYQLFHDNQQALTLFLDVCGWSQFLSDIIVREPGILDQLIDSLMTTHKKNLDAMLAELNTMLPGYGYPAAAMAAYRNQEWLRIGIRDIQEKIPAAAVQEELSDLAEAVLRIETRCALDSVSAETHSRPDVAFAVLALGKLGSRELSYNSDLDLLFVYEKKGKTGALGHAEFFSRVSQKIIDDLGSPGPHGVLYDIDTRLRPSGKNSPLANTVASFKEYYKQGGAAQLWEKMALLKIRVVGGDEQLGKSLEEFSRRELLHLEWRHGMAREMAEIRKRIEQHASNNDIKKAPGGLVDIEFIVQLLQLRHLREHPQLLVRGTLPALARLHDIGIVQEPMYSDLRKSHEFLREVESCLRLVGNLTLNELPKTPDDQEKLALRLGYTTTSKVSAFTRFTLDLQKILQHTRHHWQHIIHLLDS